jgi:outer membrane autotransporter protein
MKQFFALFTTLLATAISASGYTNVLENGSSQTVTNGWNASGLNMLVGDLTSGNTMEVVVGGAVTNLDIIIGNVSTSMNNEVSISGLNAVWKSSGDLTVGNEGSSNHLVLTSGALLENSSARIGATSNAFNNTVLVSGADSVWLNTGSIIVGAAGNSNNSVTVENGGSVIADTLQIFSNNTFNLNQDGLLELGGDFDAGQAGFNWSDDGSLSIGGNLTGFSELDGTNKMLTLNGGSWDNGTDSIVVGEDGSGNTLSVISNGIVSTTASLVVGNNGSENSVIVLSGGQLSSLNGYIGVDSNAVNNTVLISGSNSQWTVGADVVIGQQGNNNTLHIEDDGQVSLGGTLNVFGGNTLDLDDGTLSIGRNMIVTSNATVSGTGLIEFSDATDNVLVFDPLSATVSSGVLFDGKDGNNSIQLSGGDQNLSAADLSFLSHTNFPWLNLAEGNDTWLASAADTNGTFGSVIKITAGTGIDRLMFGPGGAPLQMSESLIGEAYYDFEVLDLGSDDNIWGITGLDSQYGVLIDGGIGADTLWSTGSTLRVTTDNFSSLYTNFATLNLTDNNLEGQGILDGLTTINMMGGEIRPTGTLQIDGTFNADGVTYYAEVNELNSSLLHFTGAVDLSSVTARVEVLNLPLAQLSATIVEADAGITGDFASAQITEHLLLYDISLENLQPNTIDVVATPRVGEVSSTLRYAEVQGIRAGFKSMGNAVFSRTKQLRRNTVATDYAISKDAYLMSAPDEPAGAYGPGDNNMIFGMHFWAQQYSGQGHYDSMGNSDSFTLNHSGTTFGFDKMIDDSLVAGINYTYARSTGKDNGNHVETETYWVGLYGDWFNKDDFYVEGILGFGSSDYDTIRQEELYYGTSHFDGFDVGGHMEAGKYLHHENWAFAPYIGMNYIWITTDDHNEEDLTGSSQVKVENDNIASLESVFGAKLRHRFDTRSGRFQTVGYLEWAHDFINDDIDSSLSDGTITLNTARISPDENMINTGIGVSWICTDYLEVGLGYDGRFNENYDEHTGSIMMDIMF